MIQDEIRWESHAGGTPVECPDRARQCARLSASRGRGYPDDDSKRGCRYSRHKAATSQDLRVGHKRDCGLDHLNWEGSWFTLQAPEGLKGLYNQPKGWEQSQPGEMTVLDNGNTLSFLPTGVASLELLYTRDNPQPPDGKWGCW